MFPPHIRTADEALDFLPIWAERIGGLLVNGSDASIIGPGIVVEEFRVAFETAGTDLTVAMRFDEHLRAHFYKFDLRRSDGTLLWRADCHPGHESVFGSRHHLHVGPDEGHRVAASPATLISIAEKIVSTHLGFS